MRDMQIDKDRNVYDLTRTLMEEMIFFPLSPKDDLVDAVSHVFDLEMAAFSWPFILPRWSARHRCQA
jgi:hypothetical protein